MQLRRMRQLACPGRSTPFLAALSALTALSVFSLGCDRPGPGDADGDLGKAAQRLSTCVTYQRGNNGTFADAVIASNALTTNDGASATLAVSNKKEVLLWADLSAIPSYAVVDSATLSLYINATGNASPPGILNGNGNANGLGNGGGNNTATQPINLHRATAAWSEATVTYTSFNQQFDAVIAGVIQPSSTSTLKSVDVKALVQAWVNGSKANYGVMLETLDTKQTVFVSSESAGATARPSLQVCYSVPDEHCVPNPCQNAGTCVNDWGGYTCQCAPGFTGTNCEINIDDCAGSPCLNGGACTDGVQSYTCACLPGFTGTNCETNINECAPSPCQNGGVCTDGINSYSCACPPGYAGTNCETNINECGPGPCLNNGICTDLVNGYSCQCAIGFSGVNCETNIDDCVGNACENGSSCIDLLAEYTCACLPGYAGTHCEINIDDCAGEPCLHGGTCIDAVAGYTCACAPGYTGTNCEVDINECQGSPCLNGGMCVDGVNAYTCQCAAGYSGANCEIAPSCPCTGDLAWDTALAAMPHPELYQFGSASAAIIGGVGGIVFTRSGDPDPDWQFGDDPFPPLSCGVITGSGEQLSLHTNITDIEAQACGDAMQGWLEYWAPCLNGYCNDGICSPTGGGNYTCQCPPDVTGANCEIAPSVCPSELTPAVVDDRWQWGPFQLNAFPAIHLTATFQNDRDTALDFSPDSGDLFYAFSRGVGGDMLGLTPVHMPSGSIAPGGSFTYEVIIDTSTVPAGTHTLSILPLTGNGVLFPSDVSLLSTTFDCGLCAPVACYHGTCAVSPDTQIPACVCDNGFGGASCDTQICGCAEGPYADLNWQALLATTPLSCQTSVDTMTGATYIEVNYEALNGFSRLSSGSYDCTVSSDDHTNSWSLAGADGSMDGCKALLHSQADAAGVACTCTPNACTGMDCGTTPDGCGGTMECPCGTLACSCGQSVPVPPAICSTAGYPDLFCGLFICGDGTSTADSCVSPYQVTCPCAGESGWLSDVFDNCSLPTGPMDGTESSAYGVITADSKGSRAGYLPEALDGNPPYVPTCAVVDPYNGMVFQHHANLSAEELDACLADLQAFVDAAGGTCN